MKLPFTFNLSLVFRLLLPGFFLSCATLKFFEEMLKQLGFQVESNILLLISTIVLGWLTTVMDMHIYMLFEGRRYWPNFIREICKKIENRRLAKINQRIDDYIDNRRPENKTREYLEASVERRLFPIDEKGIYVAKFPTRLGNIIASYEEYSYRAYGIESIFYWHRIWLKIDKDTRDTIDSQQAIVDSTVYMSFISYLLSILCLFYSLVIYFFPSVLKLVLVKPWGYNPPLWGLLFSSVIFFFFGYFIYFFSLQAHAQYGELYKSIFDCFAQEISFPLNELNSQIGALLRDKNNIESHRIIWRYLHNYRVKNPETGDIIPFPKWQELNSDTLEDPNN